MAKEVIMTNEANYPHTSSMLFDIDEEIEAIDEKIERLQAKREQLEEQKKQIKRFGFTEPEPELIKNLWRRK